MSKLFDAVAYLQNHGHTTRALIYCGNILFKQALNKEMPFFDAAAFLQVHGYTLENVIHCADKLNLRDAQENRRRAQAKKRRAQEMKIEARVAREKKKKAKENKKKAEAKNRALHEQRKIVKMQGLVLGWVCRMRKKCRFLFN